MMSSVLCHCVFDNVCGLCNTEVLMLWWVKVAFIHGVNPYVLLLEITEDFTVFLIMVACNCNAKMWLSKEKYPINQNVSVEVCLASYKQYYPEAKWRVEIIVQLELQHFL